MAFCWMGVFVVKKERTGGCLSCRVKKSWDKKMDINGMVFSQFKRSERSSAPGLISKIIYNHKFIYSWDSSMGLD